MRNPFITNIRRATPGRRRNVNLQVPAALILLLLLSAGCTLLSTPTPTVQPLVDSFFSGYAYLDENGNGELDDADPPVENAQFIVTMQGELEVGALTDESGYAFIVAPGGADYPVKMRMEAPKDSTLTLIGPPEITQDLGDPAPKFLFSSK